ncbi:MAG: lipocalin family protein [Bacteroidia bacterium]|nr:lipocalin family protein [Bacteroidia bacterium]MCX7651909.1 lipocalin family protein [Bacteroidia bacterium]MDW8416060.1 lipocalin family protein [Bacteroidia bacterium]
MRWIGGVSVLIFFWACQPDNPDPSGSSSTMTQRLTGGSSRTWRLQTLSFRGSSQPIPPCRADDRWTFSSDGNASLQNPNPCEQNSPEDPPSLSARWRFSNGERFIVVEGQSFFMNREIIQLTDNQLVWEYSGDGGDLVQETWVP